MNLFCLLCIPLVFFLRRTFSVKEENTIWALPLGGVAVIIYYFIGPLLTPGGFGFFRWMGGFVDIIALPALIPISACCVLVMLRVFPRTVDYAGFALLWLIPFSAVRSMYPSPSPLVLVLVPLLWIAQTTGIPFFFSCIARNPRWFVTIPSVLGITALPIAATSSWWAFFSHQTLLGFALLAVSLIPALVAITRELVVNSR
jgi:hypothetical protein